MELSVSAIIVRVSLFPKYIQNYIEKYIEKYMEKHIEKYSTLVHSNIGRVVRTNAFEVPSKCLRSHDMLRVRY